MKIDASRTPRPGMPPATTTRKPAVDSAQAGGRSSRRLGPAPGSKGLLKGGPSIAEHRVAVVARLDALLGGVLDALGVLLLGGGGQLPGALAQVLGPLL